MTRTLAQPVVTTWERVFSGRGEPAVPFAMLAAVVLWGAAFSGVKVVLRQLGPGGLTAARAVMTALSFTVLYAIRPTPRVEREPGDRLRLIVSGIALVAGYTLALTWGMQFVEAGVASVIVSTTPLMVAILSWLILRAPMGRQRTLGMVVALGGVATISVAAGEGFTARRILGLLALLGAPLSWAVYTVVTKPVAHRYDAIRLNLYGAWAAVVVTAPFLWTSRRSLLALPVSSWLWLAYLGAVVSGISMVIYAWALRRWTAAGLSSFTFLVPVAGVAWAWALLGEAPRPGMIGGGLLVIAGLVLVWQTRPVLGWVPRLYRRAREARTPT